jgi:hypothetical protein
MKKTIECQAKVLPDGHLALPDEVASQISGEQQVALQISFEEESPTTDISDGWEGLLNMPRTGGEGRLPNVAEDHDRYLYRR